MKAIKTRIAKLEKTKAGVRTICAWDNRIDPEPELIVVGNGYPFKEEETAPKPPAMP